MGEDNKKSFWASMPGILTGIASVIGVMITLITTLHLIPAPSSTNVTSPSPPPSTPAVQPTSILPPISNQPKIVCGTQLPGINNLFGSWKWVGTNNGARQSGIFTFKNYCTYTNILNGSTDTDEGHFIMNESPTTIKLQSKLGNKYTYLIKDIQNNSFILKTLDDSVYLNFTRQS